MRLISRLAVAVLLLAACSKTEQTTETAGTPHASATLTAAPAPIDPRAEYDKWRADRDQRLRREDGWLTLVGLHWLKEGGNTLGSAKSNKIVMPAKTPARMGTLQLAKGTVTFTPAAGAALTIDEKPVTAATTLQPDVADNGPTVVKSGPVQFYVIRRQGDRCGIRVKDTENPMRVNFKGMEYFPYDPAKRVEARFERYEPVKQIPITDITGVTSNNPSPGALVFELDGKTVRLDPILEEPDDLFIIFKDETSKDSTYQAGRYLYAKMPKEGDKVIVDFNKAYNPPCVFTPFATCPLPPKQNELAFRLEAGEKRFAH